jgi:hypothetical protein
MFVPLIFIAKDLMTIHTNESWISGDKATTLKRGWRLRRVMMMRITRQIERYTHTM